MAWGRGPTTWGWLCLQPVLGSPHVCAASGRTISGEPTDPLALVRALPNGLVVAAVGPSDGHAVGRGRPGDADGKQERDACRRSLCHLWARFPASLRRPAMGSPVAEKALVHDAIQDRRGLPVGVQLVLHDHRLAQLRGLAPQQDDDAVGFAGEPGLASDALDLDPRRAPRGGCRYRASSGRNEKLRGGHADVLRDRLASSLL